MTFEEYLAEVESTRRQHAELRLGQIYFNVLMEHREELAMRIGVTSWDPFYNDAKIHGFLERIQAIWDEQHVID